jgi:hypothetical protein
MMDCWHGRDRKGFHESISSYSELDGVSGCPCVCFLVAPVFAAEEFYVVKNPKTGSCKISNKKDDGQHVMIGTSSYPTAEEAKAAKNAAAECKEEKKG